MKRRQRPFIKRIIVAITIALACSIIILNVTTLFSINRIEQGDLVESGQYLVMVKSGSMEPGISVNDLLLVKAKSSYSEGDVITFSTSEGALLTHRIIETTDTGYITQGDANNVADSEISRQKVLGEVVLVVAGVGNIINGALSPLGIFLLLGIGVVLWLGRRVVGDWHENSSNAYRSVKQRET